MLPGCLSENGGLYAHFVALGKAPSWQCSRRGPTLSFSIGKPLASARQPLQPISAPTLYEIGCENSPPGLPGASQVFLQKERVGPLITGLDEEPVMSAPEGNTQKKRKVRNLANVVLMERDVSVLEFILEMKFASINDVFEKFFKVTLSGEKAKSKEWAMRRLQQLEKAGYVRGLHSFSEKMKFFLVTVKGYQVVKKWRPELDVLRPSLKIDHQTFDHDRFVLEARIMLENRRAASCWISDKRLRTNNELAGGLTNSNVPDAIYVDENGKRVAFEFELSRKSNKDYLDKVKRYVGILRAGIEAKAFDKVIYVCAKAYSFEFLKRETQIYADLFEVKRLNEFFTSDSSVSGIQPSTLSNF